MRGQKVFNDLIKEGGIGGAARKGRSNRLINKRNECLTARYFFYGYFKNHCYEEIVRDLAAEFFLSGATISHIIQENAEQIQLLKQKSPSYHFFQNRWPHLKW